MGASQFWHLPTSLRWSEIQKIALGATSSPQHSHQSAYLPQWQQIQQIENRLHSHSRCGNILRSSSMAQYHGLSRMIMLGNASNNNNSVNASKRKIRQAKMNENGETRMWDFVLLMSSMINWNLLCNRLDSMKNRLTSIKEAVWQPRIWVRRSSRKFNHGAISWSFENDHAH